MTGKAYIAGTFDTKKVELNYLRTCLEAAGTQVVTIDLGTREHTSDADFTPVDVAAHHTDGAAAVLDLGDRGKAVAAMAEAFERMVLTLDDLGGLIGAGGSGGTSMVTPAMRALPAGVPKVMVSTVASGNVGAYVGPSDICMMYSITDVQGLNRISRKVLGNAAHALAGMINNSIPESPVSDKPTIALTMFGVTTPCVQAITARLEDRFDCLVFHATGTGGRSMEKLVDSGMIEGVIDVTTTEIADHLLGGVFSAGADRMGSIIRKKIPYVGSVGAVDMVNFGAMDTVHGHLKHRNLYEHNAQVTLMRTNADENREIAKFIGNKLNAMEGPVRFFLPTNGVSLIDAPGKPFHDPAADRVLFDVIGSIVKPASNRQILRLPHNINDEAFANAMADAFLELMEAR